MIDALVAGNLHGQPEQRTGKNGKPFTVCKVRASTGDGAAVFVNVIAFAEAAQTALMALADRDSVALAGTLTPKAWTDKEGNARPALDLLAQQVLTAYSVKRRRAADQSLGTTE